MPIHYDDDHELLQVQLRKERLMESKYHIHRAVEIAYRGLALAIEAIWGGIKKEPEKKYKPKPEDLLVRDFSEAA